MKGLFKRVKTEYVVVVALSVLALFIVLKAFPKEEKTSGATDTDAYVSALEEKLERSLKRVKGAGRVDVIISVASTAEQVYCMERVTDVSGKTTETPVFIGGKPVVMKESTPEILGVIVVCEGAKTLSVKVDLLNACKVFLSVDESKIKILSA